MVGNKKFLVYFKVLAGLLGLSAVATEIVALGNRSAFNPANFFSFFTVESNLFAALVLLVGGAWVGYKQPRALALFRGAAVLYMATTGIVFSTLLAGQEGLVLTAVPWDNTVLHYIMPVVLVLDWLLDAPGVRISFRRALLWLIFPLAYLGYSLARGAATGWYPYPFLDPAKHGYAGVAVVSAGVTAVVLVLSGAVTWLGKRGGKPAPSRPA